MSFLYGPLKWAAIVLVCLSATTSLVDAGEPAGPTDLQSLCEGLRLYVPFDGTLSPAVAGGSSAIKGNGVEFEPGITGQAVKIEANESIAIPAAANFDRRIGTVSFWLKPAWAPQDKSVTSRNLFGGENFTICCQPGRHAVFFMTGKSKPQIGYRWDYTAADYVAINTWKPGEWHHIAITWDSASGAKAMYFDGRLAASSITDLIRTDPIRDAALVTIGAPDAPGSYDELAIWNRVLSPGEVALLYSRPAEAAPVLASVALPKEVRSKAWPIVVKLAVPAHAKDTVVAPHDTYTAHVPVSNPLSSPWNGTIAFTLLDFHEAVVDTKNVPANLIPGESRTIPISFSIPNRGMYKIAASIRQGTDVWHRDVASLVSWPMPTGLPYQSSFFGYHVNSWSPDVLDLAARLGLAWERDHNMLQATWFIRVEPEPDDWAFNHDFQLENVKKRHMMVLGQLFGTPYWAAAKGSLPRPSDETNAYPTGAVPDLDRLREYVTRTVNRYKNDIHYWEIWNEPEVSLFWNGSPDEFAALVKTAYQAAKAADPASVVMHAGYTGAWTWQEQVAKAGAFRYADALSVHIYGAVSQPIEDAYVDFKATYDHFEHLALAYGQGHPLPLWNSEFGLASTTWLQGLSEADAVPNAALPPMNAALAARQQVQYDCLQQEIGYIRAFSHLQSPGEVTPFETIDTLDVNNAPKPQLFVRVVMASQVDGAKCAGLVRRSEGGLWAVVYERADRGGSVICWWTGDHAKIRIHAQWPGKVTRMIDMMGNDEVTSQTPAVTDEPSYARVDAPAESVMTVLKSAVIDVLCPPVAPLPKPLDDAANVGPTQRDYAAALENPRGAFTVDLREQANMGFFDEKAGDGKGGWSDEGPLNCLATMPVGRQTFFGVPFEIIDPATNGARSIITLRGTSVTPTFPDSANAIRIGRKVRVLYFLHACSWDAKGEIAHYAIHYADGTLENVPVRTQYNCANWWLGYQQGEESRPVAVRVTSTADGKPAWRYVRVWEWQNPHPEISITSLDFVSDKTAATPILIAISGVDH
ncbi:MAG: hypothetical protein P4L33_15795 [Capsulimonadaceae bacterium]|nr:hypothetical protein [Capsulimonadaceae bacterium]